MLKEEGTVNMEENRKEPKKKKKKTGRYILLVILFLILAAIAAAAVYFYSLWSRAKDFERDLDLAHFTYKVDVELEQEGLTREQLDFFEVLARISGLEKGKFLKLHIEGSVWEDKLYAQVYPAGSAEPLMELYLSSGEDYINTSPFYDAFRDEIVRKYAFLEKLLPSMSEDSYMTVEQAERLTGEDLSAVRNFEPFFSKYNLSAREYFLILAALPFIEHEEGTVLSLKEVKEVSGIGEQKASLYFEVEEPAQVVERNVEKYGNILSRLNINIEGSSFKALKRLAVTVASEGTQEIVLPVDLIDEEKLAIVEKIRRLVQDIASLPSDSPQIILELVNRLLEGYMGGQS